MNVKSRIIAMAVAAAAFVVIPTAAAHATPVPGHHQPTTQVQELGPQPQQVASVDPVCWGW